MFTLMARAGLMSLAWAFIRDAPGRVRGQVWSAQRGMIGAVAAATAVTEPTAACLSRVVKLTVQSRSPWNGAAMVVLVLRTRRLAVPAVEPFGSSLAAPSLSTVKSLPKAREIRPPREVAAMEKSAAAREAASGSPPQP